MDNKALSVTQISTYFKQIFESEEMLFNVRVCGEISGLSIVRGIAYFTLKDEGASMSCVCFDVSQFNYNNGDKVIVTGTPRYYVKGGKLNFNVVKTEKFGLGELYKKFLELKNNLEKKGYFDEANKVPMPKQIKRIGVVTSREGAVLQDIINVRTRRNPYIDIVLYPVKVQGVGAEKEIAKAIQFFDTYNDVDLIIVARGGGSLEDLSPFNTEVVAESIHKCNKFIVSAVGHETDFTICDFCSDLRAPTPSAAAELVCVNIQDQAVLLKKDMLRLKNAIASYYLEKHQLYLSLVQKIANRYKSIVDNKQNILKNNIVKLKHITVRKFDVLYNFISLLNSKLNKLNPSEVLKLGYATVKHNNKAVVSVNELQIGDNVEVSFKDGSFDATIKSIKGDKNGF